MIDESNLSFADFDEDSRIYEESQPMQSSKTLKLNENKEKEVENESSIIIDKTTTLIINQNETNLDNDSIK
jgi:hypothetical protein